LAQDLNQLCLEAVDAYELAAHVEALGYNRYRIQREFGLQGPFELGRRLFMRSPFRHTFATPAPATFVLRNLKVAKSTDG